MLKVKDLNLSNFLTFNFLTPYLKTSMQTSGQT